MTFDRGKAYGKRLHIAAGTAVRFEPGDCKTVTLVDFGGAKKLYGGNRLASGQVDLSRTDAIVADLVQKGYGYEPEPSTYEISVDTPLSHETYAAMFGPTMGDKVRLGDTALWVEVEKDLVCPTWLSYSHFIIDALSFISKKKTRRATVMKSSSVAERPSVREWARLRIVHRPKP